MMQQLKIFIIIAVFGALISCRENHENKKNSTSVLDTCRPVYSISKLNDKFEFAFKNNSLDTLEQIFVDWNKTLKPNTREFMEQNDTIKAVFTVYKEFYMPLDLLKLGNWEWGNKLNSDCKYVLVQNKIFYSIVESGNFDDFSWQSSRIDSIENFRPPLNLDYKKVLYLTSEYNKSLNQFLGTESTKMGDPNIMNPSRPAGESEIRYEMIRPFIPILHGHWGGYWHLETHPYVSRILFNKNLTEANINFRVGYQGGEATLKKTLNGWIISESKSTWIE